MIRQTEQDFLITTRCPCCEKKHTVEFKVIGIPKNFRTVLVTDNVKLK